MEPLKLRFQEFSDGSSSKGPPPVLRGSRGAPWSGDLGRAPGLLSPAQSEHQGPPPNWEHLLNTQHPELVWWHLRSQSLPGAWLGSSGWRFPTSRVRASGNPWHSPWPWKARLHIHLPHIEPSFQKGRDFQSSAPRVWATSSQSYLEKLQRKKWGMKWWTGLGPSALCSGKSCSLINFQCFQQWVDEALP